MFALLIFTIFVATTNSIQNSPFLFYNFCTTPECKEVGSHIDYALNKSISPCDDFYGFSCGGWISKTPRPSHEPVWSYWQSIGSRINERLDAVLQSQSSGDDDAFSKAQLLYRTCLKVGGIERSYLKQLRYVVNKLGGWPLSTYRAVEDYQWILEIVRVVKSFGSYPILKIFPEIDYTNTTRHVLYIQQGKLNLPKSVLTNPEENKQKLDKYKLWIYQTAKYLYPVKIRNHVKADITRIIDFEIQLAKLSQLPDETQRMSIKNLSTSTGLNWLQVLNALFEKTDFNVTNEHTVVVDNVSHLRQLIYFVNSTAKSTVANYIIWSVVKDLSRDTTKYMRKLNFLMDKTFLGIHADVSRVQECISKVNEYMSFAAVSSYVDSFLQPDLIKTVDSMVQNIKIRFVELLQANKWLSKQTKNNAIEKIVAVEHYIGYPEWSRNKTYVNNLYGKLNITNNHFLNVIRMKQFHLRQKLMQMHTYVSDIEWPSSPFEVNAYYSVLQNSIVLPLGILEPPFFDIDRPEVFNYGALGSLIGHEISHALDTTGRRFDKSGQLAKWWQKADIVEYQSRGECFERQYDKFGVDGSLTAGENIADNVGLQISYEALENSRGSRFHVVVPHLEQYTKEQLYFISFAQLWCEISNESGLLNEGEHSPVKQRVLGTLYNTEQFDTAFRCRRNISRCVLW